MAGWCKAGVEDLVYLFIGYGAAAFPWWWLDWRKGVFGLCDYYTTRTRYEMEYAIWLFAIMVLLSLSISVVLPLEWLCP
jgi:hypothetical protein